MSFGRTRSGWTRRDRLSGNNSPEFEVVKAGEVEVKPRFAQLADFEREHLEIPSIYFAHQREVVLRDGMWLAVGPSIHPLDGERVGRAIQVEGSVEKAAQSEADRAKIRTVLGSRTQQEALLK